MYQTTFQQWLEVIIRILPWLGITSVVGFLGMYSTWLMFPPKLIIETVIDKSKTFNSESTIKIKNIGKLPALNIRLTAKNLNARFGVIKMQDCNIENSIPITTKLWHSETLETLIQMKLNATPGMTFSELDYVLHIEYQAKLLFLKKQLSRQWRVELRNFQDGYTWNIRPL